MRTVMSVSQYNIFLLTLCVGLHDRLGAGSLLSFLDDEVLRQITASFLMPRDSALSDDDALLLFFQKQNLAFAEHEKWLFFFSTLNVWRGYGRHACHSMHKWQCSCSSGPRKFMGSTSRVARAQPARELSRSTISPAMACFKNPDTEAPFRVSIANFACNNAKRHALRT